MRTIFLMSFIFCSSLMSMETEKTELNEIPSLQELCIPKIAQYLNEQFDLSDYKKKFLRELNQIPFNQLPEPIVKALTTKMLENNNEIIAHFPPTFTKKIEAQGGFKSIWYDQDTKQIITGIRNGKLDYWDIDTGKLNKLIHLDNSVLAIAFNKDRTKIVSGDEDGGVHFWQDLNSLNGQTQLSGDENMQLAAHDKSHYYLAPHITDSGKLTDIRLSNNDSEVTISFENGRIVVWNIVKRSLTHQFIGDNVRCCCYDPNRSQCAVGYAEGMIHLYKPAQKYKLLCRLTGHIGAVESLQYNNAGTQLISTGKDKIIRFWDPKTGNFLFLIKPEVRYTFDVAINNNDTLLAIGPCNIGEIHLYNLERKQLSQLSPVHFFLLRYIFSHNGSSIHLPKQLMNHYEKIPQELRDHIESNKLITSISANCMHAIL